MSKPTLIVAKRPGVERPATRREVCQHLMVRREVFSGGKQLRTCATGCGHSDWMKR